MLSDNFTNRFFRLIRKIRIPSIEFNVKLLASQDLRDEMLSLRGA